MAPVAAALRRLPHSLAWPVGGGLRPRAAVQELVAPIGFVGGLALSSRMRATVPRVSYAPRIGDGGALGGSVDPVSEDPEAPVFHPWWGRHEIPSEGATLTIGALQLLVQRDAREWRLAHRRDPSIADDVSAITPGVDFEASEAERRVLVARAGRTLEIVPRLADRAVVARPVMPLRLPAGERIDLFVGTPLFVVLRAADGPELDELPSIVPAETWFGPSPVRGELCYAARTRASVEVGALPKMVNRALTRVTLVNAGKDAMNVERLRLPVTRLRLGYHAGTGRLVTDDVTLERESDGETVNVAIAVLSKEVKPLSSPREAVRSSWKHALSGLWA